MSYTLIAYRPSSSVPACARGCCGYNHFESTHKIERDLVWPVLIERIARLQLEDETYEGEEKWQLTYLTDVRLDEEGHQNFLDQVETEAHYRRGQLKNEAMLAAEQATREKEAEEARVETEARLKAEQEQEEHDKSEYERLHRKFGNVD